MLVYLHIAVLSIDMAAEGLSLDMEEVEAGFGTEDELSATVENIPMKARAPTTANMRVETSTAQSPLDEVSRFQTVELGHEH